MMNKTLIFIFLLTVSNSFSQGNIDFKSIENKIINLGTVANGNENFSDFDQLKPLLKDVEIVMLGEQSHGEGTTYESKIKLIKYLHQELGFEILAFESGFYDTKKAWDLIENNEDVATALAESIFEVWSTTKEFKPLVDYIEKTKTRDKKLKILGFDGQFTGKLTKKHFVKDLSSYLNSIDPSITKNEEWTQLTNNLNLVFDFKSKKLKKREVSLDTIFINKIIKKVEQSAKDKNSSFWIKSLETAKTALSDLGLKTDFRDRQMADNLIWIKEHYPNKKIICWGATSHFLYKSENVEMKSMAIRVLAGNYYKNHLMMGDYLKAKYKTKLFTIGFTAFQGEYGFVGVRKKIETAKPSTLEFLLSKSEYDNFLLPLNNLNFENYLSRPLGNYYMKNNISKVMDAVIFNRNMKRPRLDRTLYLKIYPENKWIKPETEN